jgi:hypothetical protein
MTHYAKVIDGNVIKVVAFEDEKFSEFVDDSPGQWVKTNQQIGVGFTYADGKFAPAKPFESWKLNSENNWKAPKPYPQDGSLYRWDEPSLSWVAENF